jgi:NTE family protein
MNACTKLMVSAVVAALIGGCGSFPVNPKLETFDPQSGYRLDHLEPGDHNTDSLFVVVTMSGGGTRAAALSYGVLDALRRTSITWKGESKSLLQEVDMVSSVSGGSFTAAYYALHHEGLFDGRFERTFLNHDVQGDLVRRLLVPTSWLKLAGASYGRSDLGARYYDEHIFDGAKYRDLVEAGRRPFVIINATDMTLGAQFPFIQDQFDLLCSDLSGVSVARAVAASSAFPGLLTPLTFQNYAGQCGFEDYPWVGLAEADRRDNVERTIRADHRRSYYERPVSTAGSRPFVHLIDGGVSDNIGLRGPLYAIASTDPTYSILRKIDKEEVEKLVVIVVNAATSPKTSRDRSARVPGAGDVIETAATVPMDNYSVDSVSLLKAKVSEFNAGYDNLRACEEVLKEACPGSTLDSSALYPVDLYVIQVAFEFIQDESERNRFKNIATTFSLPKSTVDALEKVGCTLFRDDPDLTRLLSGTGRTQDEVRGTPPRCP